MEDKKEEYNNVPVYYCKQCLSLRILGIPGFTDLDFCDDCGSSNIEEISIWDWINKYRDKYGKDFLTLK